MIIKKSIRNTSILCLLLILFANTTSYSEINTQKESSRTNTSKKEIEHTCVGENGVLSNAEADLIIMVKIISIHEQPEICPYSFLVKTKTLEVIKGNWDHEYFYLPIHRSELGPSFKEGDKKELKAVINEDSYCYLVKDKEIIDESTSGLYEPDCLLWH